jgi:hypothetical protein
MKVSRMVFFLGVCLSFQATGLANTSYNRLVMVMQEHCTETGCYTEIRPVWVPDIIACPGGGAGTGTGGPPNPDPTPTCHTDLHEWGFNMTFDGTTFKNQPSKGRWGNTFYTIMELLNLDPEATARLQIHWRKNLTDWGQSAVVRSAHITTEMLTDDDIEEDGSMDVKVFGYVICPSGEVLRMTDVVKTVEMVRVGPYLDIGERGSAIKEIGLPFAEHDFCIGADYEVTESQTVTSTASVGFSVEAVFEANASLEVTASSTLSSKTKISVPNGVTCTVERAIHRYEYPLKLTSNNWEGDKIVHDEGKYNARTISLRLDNVNTCVPAGGIKK